MIARVDTRAIGLRLSLFISVLTILTAQSIHALDPPAADDKIQVVSVNLCTDQLVMLLADPEQILALGKLSRDEAGSYYHELAGGFDQANPIAEQILPLAPDVVVTGPYTSRYTLNLLDELGVRVETLPIANSIDEMLANLKRMGELLGRSEYAGRIVESLERKLEAMDARVRLLSSVRPRVAVYDTNGYTVGDGTLRGEVINRAGWYNVASDEGIDGYGVLGLENLITLKPQALIESPYSSGSYSRGQTLTRHPAIRASGLDPAIIRVPSNQTICAGPWTVDVIEQLAEAREVLLQNK